MESGSFLIRVYGIYIDADRRILLSDEFVYGKEVIKFPGGGLEFGEGLRDGLVREMLEETGCEFEVLDHFYTTDFFVASAFHDQKQLISVYYFIEPIELIQLKVSDVKFDFSERKDRAQSFRWCSMDQLAGEEITFPIDRYVAGLLINRFC